MVYTTDTLHAMERAKVFQNGRSQAVRIPKEFRFNVSEVFIHKDEITGDVILSTRKPGFTWGKFCQALREVPEEERREFMANRNIIESERGDLF